MTKAPKYGPTFGTRNPHYLPYFLKVVVLVRAVAMSPWDTLFGRLRILLTRFWHEPVFGQFKSSFQATVPRYKRVLEPTAAEFARPGGEALEGGKGSGAVSRFELREKARSTILSNIGISESETSGL